MIDGANHGLFVHLIDTNKKVLALEPTDHMLRLLTENLENNNSLAKTILINGVASDINGKLELTSIEGREEYSSLFYINHPSAKFKNRVKNIVDSYTLDKLVKQNNLDSGFIKIDVEGAEHMAFKGMNDILKNKRPIVFSELILL